MTRPTQPKPSSKDSASLDTIVMVIGVEAQVTGLFVLASSKKCSSWTQSLLYHIGYLHHLIIVTSTSRQTSSGIDGIKFGQSTDRQNVLHTLMTIVSGCDEIGLLCWLHYINAPFTVGLFNVILMRITICDAPSHRRRGACRGLQMRVFITFKYTRTVTHTL